MSAARRPSVDDDTTPQHHRGTKPRPTTAEDLIGAGRPFVDLFSTSKPNAAGFVRVSRTGAYEAARTGAITTVRLGGKGSRLRVPVAKLLEMAGIGLAYPAAPTAEAAESSARPA